MKATPGEIETLLATLAETPGFIAEVCTGLGEAELRLAPAPGEWSLVELLAHLHACAEVWGDDIGVMLMRDEPRFTKPHPRQVMKQDRFLTPSFADSFIDFSNLRARLLGELKSLDFELWERGATINQRWHTVFTHARRMALHEHAHREQFRGVRAFVIEARKPLGQPQWDAAFLAQLLRNCLWGIDPTAP
jgi:hypothetical protein